MSSNNSSKTAHVMNLLSKHRGASEPEEKATAPQEELTETVPAEPARTAPVAPIISSINADAAVSSQIKDALEAEIETEIVQAPEAPPVPEEILMQQAPIAEEAEEPIQMVPEAPEEPVVPMDLPAAPEPQQEEEAAYINVMQILVDEKADEYMKLFGLCCCDKCRVDVRAYALNHLPPKYVVLSEHERVPRLTIYESRFASDITAQLTQACKQIMRTPHHTRNDN